MTGRVALVALIATVGLPRLALAQALPVAGSRSIELSVGGTLMSPAPAGSSSATLITSNGSRLTVFEAESRTGPGFGADATLGFRLASGVWIEAAGGWSRATASTRVSGDVETAPALTVSETISRLSAEAGLLIYFADRGDTSWFVRGSGGWMRELVAGNALADDGVIATGGGGLRHWFRQNGAGAVKRVGVRAEGRLIVRTGGVAFGDAGLRLAPAGSVFIVFGF